MGGNIIKQSREIGVLRCIGVKKKEIILLYVYEAFVLVFSSSLFGILIGWLIGYTMTA
jgi:ABC-type antimicrobial peptide transport system permease subunit